MAFAALVLSTGGACSALREDSTDAGTGADAATALSDANAIEDSSPPTKDSSVPDGSTAIGYDDTQRSLEAVRSPGPVTAQGSRGTCTDSSFAWRDMDGSIHSWSGTTRIRLDYPFKAPRPAGFFPSDVLMPVDDATFSELSVYRTDGTAGKLAGLEYATYFVAANDGVLRLDQKIANVDQGGTKIRRWIRSSGITEDVTTVLPTRQPPSSYGLGELVVPGDGAIPFPLYIVDVVQKTVASLTFDGALALRDTLPTSSGLLVSYARTGPTSALRLYKGNRDTNRVEVGDELANRPRLFSDTSPDEHKFLSRVATYGNWVIYDSSIGIFAFDLEKGRLVPVQLGEGKKAFLVDVLCVMSTAKLLAYRKAGDVIGQIWTVPLGSILPF